LKIQSNTNYIALLGLNPGGSQADEATSPLDCSAVYGAEAEEPYGYEGEDTFLF